MSFAKITIVGNLGHDPDLRYTPQGTPVCSFSVATSERRKDKQGEYQEHTTWFRVTLYGRMAETAKEHLHKGRQVYLEGRVRLEEWVNRDGQPRYTLEVHGTDLQFIGDRGTKPEASQRSDVGDQPAPESARFKPWSEPTSVGADDEVPF